MKTLIEQIAELAREVTSKSPFELPRGMHDSIYEDIADGVLCNYLSQAKDDREMILLATVVHLLVENAVLNYNLILLSKEGE